MNLSAIPDHHTQYLLAHPGEAYGYLRGRQPSIGWLGRLGGKQARVPEDWPREPAREMAIDENLGTDAVSMHYLLNGVLDPVDAASDLFQGWITGQPRQARRLGGLRTFAFLHDRSQVDGFDDCLRALDDAALFTRSRDNLARCGSEADELDLQGVRSQLQVLRDVYSDARRQNRCVLFAPWR